MSHSKLFFALPCSQDLTRQLADWRSTHLPDSAPHWVPEANFHITLAFLGQVPDSLQETLFQIAGQISLPAFELSLSRYGNWADSGILWLAPTQTPAPLQTLADRLRQAAQDLGLHRDRRGYHPHLTLARHQHAPLPSRTLATPFVLQASHFALYRSISTPDGVRYQAIRHWPLQAGADGATDGHTEGPSKEQGGSVA